VQKTHKQKNKTRNAIVDCLDYQLPVTLFQISIKIIFRVILLERHTRHLAEGINTTDYCKPFLR